MKKQNLLKAAVASAATLMVLAPLAARADVKIERVTHVSEVTGITSHDSDTTDYIQGDKKREENLRKFTGSVLGAWQKFRGNDNGSADVDIYLVSQNKHYDLDPKKKTYNEDKIYDPSQPQKAPQDGGKSQQQQEQQDKDTKVTKNELTVKDTGKTQTLNGFDTHEYLITWDYETLNTKTNETSKSLMTTDMWTSGDAKLAKAHEEEVAYEKAYLKLMQIPTSTDDAKVYGFGSGTLTINGQDQKEFFTKLHSIKGLPVSTDVTWEVAGTDSNGKPTNDSDAGKDSNKNLDSALGSLFGGNKSKDDSSSQMQKQGTPGMTTIFSSHVEVKSVDTSAMDASQFQVPTDYKVDD